VENFVTISGCSSGGKSTLLVELRRRGFATIDEPGRRIVVEELERGGRALPWVKVVKAGSKSPSTVGTSGSPSSRVLAVTANARIAHSFLRVGAANLEKRIFGISPQKKEFRRHPD
jgi:hypothetical protein